MAAHDAVEYVPIFRGMRALHQAEKMERCSDARVAAV
jgi:hypothetical protein